jgi:hypothetical protein
MRQFARLEVLFSSKVLSVWRLTTIFLIVISFVVPLFYEPLDSDGLFIGSTNLATLTFFDVFIVFMVPFAIYDMFHSAQVQISQALLETFWMMLNIIGPFSFFAYAMLNIGLLFGQWQQRFMFRFWLLGLSFVWIAFFARSYSSLLWGFNVIVCTVVLAALLECVSYIVCRRRSNVTE